MCKYNKKCAEKTGMVINKLCDIAKSRFKSVFGTLNHSVDIEATDFSKLIWPAQVCTIRSKKNGKIYLRVSYLAPKGSPEQIENYSPSDNYTFLYDYHKNLLHEYGELFLFHNDLLNPLDATINYTAKERKAVCDQFVAIHLNRTTTQ